MGTGLTTAPWRASERQAAFVRVLCGIDATRTDAEAVRQGAVLASPDGRLEIVCDAFEIGTGGCAQATIARSRAEEALKRGRQIARELGVHAETRLISHREPWRGVLRELPGHDLLVVGSRPGSRAGGIFLGGMATEAVHRAAGPVLVARAAANVEATFPKRLLVASDGSPDSRRAIDLALRICRAHESEVLLVTVGEDPDRERRHELAEQAAQVFQAAGVEPVVLTPAGGARTAIVELAHRHSASLVVVGSGGKVGLRAIGSVSEHVAHHAPCSVLVARPAEP